MLPTAEHHTRREQLFEMVRPKVRWADICDVRPVVADHTPRGPKNSLNYPTLTTVGDLYL